MEGLEWLNEYGDELSDPIKTLKEDLVELTDQFSVGEVVIGEFKIGLDDVSAGIELFSEASENGFDITNISTYKDAVQDVVGDIVNLDAISDINFFGPDNKLSVESVASGLHGVSEALSFVTEFDTLKDQIQQFGAVGEENLDNVTQKVYQIQETFGGDGGEIMEAAMKLTETNGKSIESNLQLIESGFEQGVISSGQILQEIETLGSADISEGSVPFLTKVKNQFRGTVAQLKASVASSLETFSPFINQVGNVAGSLESVMPSVRKLRRGIRSVGRFMKGFGDKMKVLSPIMRGLSLSQIRLNIAMIANPVGLIVMGIAALIALVTVVIVKYNEWGAALTLIMGPLGFVINLIQSFRRNWELITEAFSNDGIVAGLKMIGVTILDAILMPIQQVLELMSYLPFIGDLAGDGANSIKEFRKEIGANVEEENEEEEQQAKPSKKEVEEQEPIYVNPLSDSKTTNSNPTYGSGATASTKTSSTAGIASGGKKVINVRIERLIDNLNINTQNVKESTAEIKSLVTRAIMDSVRDAEVAI